MTRPWYAAEFEACATLSRVLRAHPRAEQEEKRQARITSHTENCLRCLRNMCRASWHMHEDGLAIPTGEDVDEDGVPEVKPDLPGNKAN